MAKIPVRQKKRNSPQRRKRSRKGFWSGAATLAFFRKFLKRRMLLRVAVQLAVLGAVALALIIFIYSYGLPDISTLNTIKKQQGITITTEDGRVIANYGDVYGEYVPFEQLPKTLIEAALATEDRRFFNHYGVDIFGIARAMITNAKRGQTVQGGSTITQQLAKNVFLKPDRTLSRKIQEVLLALELEAHYSKKEILAIYLNRVYLGSGAYGVDAASRRYFNKPATDLSLAESALLVGLLKAPSRYSPVANMERAEKRTMQVLLNMVDAGYIEEAQIQPALKSLREAPAHETGGGEARYFADWIVDQIPEVIGNSEEDLVVTTTMATTLQAAASDALRNTVATEGEGKNITQGALVAMTPDGAVKAMIGGLNYSESQYNRAAQAKRQPGSSFKLFVYLAALEAGMTPETLVLDAPITIKVGNRSWTPNNFQQDFKGEIPMVQALRESLNTVAVRLAQAAGIGNVAALAERLGIPDVPEHPSIALGSVEATLLEMTTAFAHLPNHGLQVEPYGILEIKNRAGKELYKREEPSPRRVLSDDVVEMMNYMLIDAARRGTGARAALPGRPVAGKTGTSQQHKDAWFIGFTPQLVTGVWVGNDNNAPMKKITGGTVPALVWRHFMTFAMSALPAADIPNRATNSMLPWLFGQKELPPEGAAPSQPPEDQPITNAPR